MSPKCVKRERDEVAELKKVVVIGKNVIADW